MKIGRGTSNRVYIPNSDKSMYNRSQPILEGVAKAQATKYNNAIQIDGPLMLFWNKQTGVVPCSCSSTKDMFDFDAGADLVATTKSHTATIVGMDKESRARPVKTSKKATTLDDLFDIPIRDRVATDNVAKSFDPEADDILNAFDDTSEDLVDFDDPFNLFGRKINQCPVCLGTGFIDSWNPYAGSRIVLDTSNYRKFDATGCDIDSTATPTTVKMLAPKSLVTWSMRFPYMWDKIIRVNVYNGKYSVAPSMFNISWLDTSRGAPIKGQLSLVGLEALQQSKGDISIFLEALEPIEFTHVEIILTYAPLLRGQIPEISQEYDDELDDWGVSISMELPTTVTISEGDYLTEAKYKRVWKVNAVNIRKTINGEIFGISADVRALNRFESTYYILSVFKENKFGYYINKENKE